MSRILHSMPIKKARANGVQRVFIVDKNSAEARTQYKNEWTSRILITCEYALKRGWKMGFFTLTYGTGNGKNFEGFRFNSNSLPHLPLEMFKNVRDYVHTPCFDRTHIQAYMKFIRERIDVLTHRRYKIDDVMQWAIFGEYGSVKHRPHYHGIILFNPSIITPEQMYQMLRYGWESKKAGFHGFFGPHNFNGGNWCGTNEMPFLVQDAKATGSYVAKYATKDLEFAQNASHLNLWKPSDTPAPKNSKDYVPMMDYRNMYRRYFPFHIQSRKLGACILNGKNDAQLLELLEKGVIFAGDIKYRALPKYIERKILTNNWYDWYFKDGEKVRQVHSEASDFWRKYSAEVYAIKFKKKLESIGEQWMNISSTLKHNSNFCADYPFTTDFKTLEKLWSSQVQTCNYFVSKYGLESIVEFGLLYYGRNIDYCRVSDDKGLIYLSKALNDFELVNCLVSEGTSIKYSHKGKSFVARSYDFEPVFTAYNEVFNSLPVMDKAYFDEMNYAWSILSDTLHGSKVNDYVKLAQESKDNYYKTLLKEKCL